MIPFFSRMPEVAAPIQFPRKWDYLRTGLKINLQRVQTFAQIYPKAVNSSHFLIRLLMSLAVPMSLPTARYYDSVDDRARVVSSLMGMTSPYAKGKTHDGIFYGEGCTEVLILNEDFVDFLWVHEHWQEATPITVLHHPKSDLDLLIPDGVSYSNESGLAVISINIAMLAVMYRAFTLEQTRKSDSLSPYQFIAGWVLPNMLNSHLDLAIFNRIQQAAFGEDKVVLVNRRHSFSLVNYDFMMNQSLLQQVELLSRLHRSFTTMVHGMPAISQQDMADVLQMPDLYATTQIDWILFACRVPAITLLLKLCGKTALATDRDVLVRMMRAYAHNNVEFMIEQQLPSEISAPIFTKIEQISSLIQ